MFEVAMKSGYAISCKENYAEYLKQKEYKMKKMPKKINGKIYTLK